MKSQLTIKTFTPTYLRPPGVGTTWREATTRTLRANLDAALVDYEAAFDLIEPKKNSGAKGDKALAAFRAGYTALQLGQPERAAQWYLQAVTLAEQNNLDVELEREITKLQTLLEGSTDATLAASGEKILAQAQAAYDRMEQR